MSAQPSLNAALKRLDQYRDYYCSTTGTNPYRGAESLFRDIELVTAAMRLTADCAEHTDDGDAQPIFTVRLPCDWRDARKGFLYSLSQCRGRTVEDVG